MSRAIVITRLIASVALAVTFAVAAPGATMAASPTPAPTNVMKPPAGWATLKASLNSNPNLQKTVSVSGNTRTITYTSKDGLALVLQEPVAGTPSNAVQPNFSVGGCFWFQECIYLNHHELVVISAGLGALVVAQICLGSAGTLCPLAAGIVGAALAAETEYGICPNTFRIEVWPVPLAPWSWGCW